MASTRPERIDSPVQRVGSLVPMVGREQELERLRTKLADISVGAGGAIVLLSGEAGIGKTRLAQELSQLADDADCEVYWGASREHAGAPPYWPWIRALRGDPLDRFEAVLRDSVGDRADGLIRLFLGSATATSPNRVSEEARFRLFDEVAAFLRASARQRPLLLVLEDLHWADETSLKLLEFVAPEIADAPVVIVCTFRDDEVGRRHPLSDTLGLLAALPHVDRVRMTRLSDDSTRQLLAHVTGRVPKAEFVDAVHSRTAGNPFFTQEVARLLLESGGTSIDDIEALSLKIPDTVRGAIGRRLNRLSDACMELLGVAAVLGPEYDLLTLRALLQSTGEIDEPLNEAFGAGVLLETSQDGGGYSFAHPLVREELYEGLGAARRERLHRLAGETLERLRGSESESHLNELAFHFREAAPVAGARKAVDYLRRAGEWSAAQFAWADAIRDLTSAIQLHEQSFGEQRSERIELRVSLGIAQAMSGDEESAVATLTEAADLALDLGDPELAARATASYAHWASVASFGFAAPSIMLRLQRALELLDPENAALRAGLLGEMATSSLYLPPDDPHADDALQLSEEALALARTLDAPDDLLEALVHAYRAAWPPQLVERRAELAAEILHVSEATDDVAHWLTGYTYSICLQLERGFTREAERQTTESEALAERFGSPRHRAYGHLRRCWLGLVRGEFGTAEDEARAAVESGVTATHSFAVAALAMIGRAQGRLHDFDHEITPDFFAACEAAGGSGRVVLALVDHGLDRTADCRMRYESLASADFATIERDSDRAAALAGLAELCVALEDRQRARGLYALIEPYRDSIAVSHMGVYGSLARHLGLLARLMDQEELAVSHFEHALARNREAEALPWLALTQADYAELLMGRDGDGDIPRARELISESEGTARSLGMAPLAERCSTLLESLTGTSLPAPDGLTPRELEVLTLVARGLSNAEVADELVLSVRTVERHITNLYGKIGASGRAAAATYAVRQGLMDATTPST
jgi:DNA-binding CsgD family transcriptional regulator